MCKCKEGPPPPLPPTGTVQWLDVFAKTPNESWRVVGVLGGSELHKF
jgi:hypothetical protein